MYLEIHLDCTWRDCAVVAPTTQDLSLRGGVRLQYEADYATVHLDARDYRALSVRVPVNLAIRTLPQWPSFLVDLLPQGAARKRLERSASDPLSPWDLLERGAINPVGNLRVRPQQPRHHRSHPGFDLHEIIERGDAFVDYALELGAAVAGATDTQGEAPKFWVVEDESGRWHPDSGELPFPIRRHALLKFPVPEAGPQAQDILRHEAVYQSVAARCGLRVTGELPTFTNGALLIPRFDRRVKNRKEIRLGVESLYSVAGVLDAASVFLRHDHLLIALARCVSDFRTELSEYVRRDLFNLALGNRDNHGRNTAILKDVDGTIRLAPLYDFGPAFLDSRAIARVIRWEGEAGGEGWSGILERLDQRFQEADLEPPSPIFRQAIAQTLPALEFLPRTMLECAADPDVVKRRSADIARLLAALEAARV